MKFKKVLINLLTTALLIFSFVLPVSAEAVVGNATSQGLSYTVKYRAHVADIGWMDPVDSPDEAGTTGQARQMEALEVEPNPNGINLTVQAHVEDIGWMDPVTNAAAGTTGESKRLEAVKINVAGENANKYDVSYSAHVSNLGWTDWVKNGDEAGTTGQALPIEAVCINVLPKAPADVTDASGFAALSQVAPEILQEVRYYTDYNFVGTRIDGYEQPTILMSKDAAQNLKEANDELMTKGFQLKVYDAYRPQMAVDHFVRWAQDLDDQRMKPYFYPEVDKSVLFEQDYIAEKSGHSRGSTVDLTIVHKDTGEDLDMGGTFDLFSERSHPDFIGDLTQEQIDNRNLLRETMINHGFKPLYSEWWHFTLRNEPYPDTYFNFPVNDNSVAH